jgi:glutathione S-transferase
VSSDFWDQRLYHLALRDEWQAAVDHGDYRQSTLGRSLEDEGFIHCSYVDQLQPTADLVYRGRHDVVLLTIDPSRVGAEVRAESLAPGGESFPHIYGPLPIGAVVLAQSVPVMADGRLRLEHLVDQ